MKTQDFIAWVGVTGAVAMTLAASFVDWRAGLFVAGLVLWADAR